MNYRIKIFFISFAISVFFSSCAPAVKLLLNIKNPKVYSSYTEVEPIIVSQINKLGITDYTILYSYKKWEETLPLYFDGYGQPISRTYCGIIDTKTKILFTDTTSLNYKIQDFVTKECLPFTKELFNYDYIVVMPKTTFMIGVEKRLLRDVRFSIPTGSLVYYLFVSTDFYLWQDSRFKAGEKGKIKIQKDNNQSIMMIIKFRERYTKVKKNESIEK